jgi:hypothetical protein
MVIGEWSVDELGVPPRKITARALDPDRRFATVGVQRDD